MDLELLVSNKAHNDLESVHLGMKDGLISWQEMCKLFDLEEDAFALMNKISSDYSECLTKLKVYYKRIIMEGVC